MVSSTPAERNFASINYKNICQFNKMVNRKIGGIL
jgi:hypothetical protein